LQLGDRDAFGRANPHDADFTARDQAPQHLMADAQMVGGRHLVEQQGQLGHKPTTGQRASTSGL
jgi:hypothetical protein